MDAPAISAAELRQSLAGANAPLVIDVRRNERFREAPDLVRGALRLGLSLNCKDDLEMLAQGMALYDALYSWCRNGKSEVHTWNPGLYQ